MKIAVIGTFQVGKTSVIEGFTRRLPQYQVIPEYARELIEESERDIRGDREFQLKVMNMKLAAERELVKMENLISDRTAIDNWAFCKHHQVFSESVTETVRVFAVEHTNSYYDVVVYLPIEDDMQPVPEEEKEREFREAVDNIVRESLQYLDNVVIVKGTIEKKVEKLISIAIDT